MIELSLRETGDVNARMHSPSPMVYLDHWALRQFSGNEELGRRLSQGIKSQGGTLAISWLNIAEFIKVTIEEQLRKAESVIEATFPHVFILEVNPFHVIDRENKLLKGGPPVPPHADMDFFESNHWSKSKGDQLTDCPRPLNAVQDEASLQRFNKLADTIIERVETLRAQLERDSDLRSAIERSPGGKRIQRGTRFIVRELVRTLLIDTKTRMTRNHAMDLLHAVVPAAYCDFLLLDKHWETQVDRIRSRLTSSGVEVPIAKVFSGKRDNVCCRVGPSQLLDLST